MKNIFAILAILLSATFAARAESTASIQPPVAAITAATGVPDAPAPAAPAAPVEAIAPKRKEDEAETPSPAHTGSPGLLDRIKAALTSNKNVAELHAQITAISGERDNARTQLAALQAQIAALTSERDTAHADLAKITALLDGQRDIVKATAAEIASTVGQPMSALPAPLTEEAADKPQATYTEFKAMDASARDQFFAKGGKIVG